MDLHEDLNIILIRMKKLVAQMLSVLQILFHILTSHTANENSIYVFLFWELHSQFVFERFICSQDRSTYLAAAK
jgi:hypothetical protein